MPCNNQDIGAIKFLMAYETSVPAEWIKPLLKRLSAAEKVFTYKSGTEEYKKAYKRWEKEAGKQSVK